MPGKLAARRVAACFFNITRRQQLQTSSPGGCRLSCLDFATDARAAAFSIYGFINHSTQYFTHGEGEAARPLIEISQSTHNEKRSNWQQLLLIVLIALYSLTRYELHAVSHLSNSLCLKSIVCGAI
jgi:hypothetical protein